MFVNSINNEINDSKVRVKRIGQFNMNLDLTEYVWKLSDLNVKINNKDDLETYGSVISKPINDFNKGNPNLNSPSVTYTNQVNSIKLNNDSKVDGLGSNINSSFSTLNDINLKDVKKVDDLGKNINSTFANNNKIDFDKQNKVSNLNDNIEFQTGRNNEIELNDIKRIGNLSSNIGFVSGNKTDINFKPSTAIGNTINTYQTNTNNINSDNIPKGNYDLGSGITVANSGYNGISNIKSNDMKDIINHE